MKTVNWKYWILLSSAFFNVAIGLSQVLMPATVMAQLHVTVDVNTLQFFATLGFLLVVIGGLQIQSFLFTKPDQPLVVFWSGVEKLGAAVAVAIGALHHVFGPIMFFVGFMSVLLGLLHLWYWSEIRDNV
jgi:hypothetical protein